MSRNIVVCCDGTGNEFGEHNSNVVKLCRHLERESGDQLVLYDPGVGTGNKRQALTPLGRRSAQLMGLAFGAGLYRNIVDAYAYLMNVWQPGDQIYLFGFSRGAYTVRALSGFLNACGLLEAGNHSHVPYALEIYRRQRFDYFARFKKTFSRPCPVHFVGVWDTVKSVGVWDALMMFTRRRTALPYTFDMSGVSFARQALAIDEKRSRFQPNMWRGCDKRNLQQVWFPGVHCDVGGGYPVSELSDIALKWMLVGAQEKGLRLTDGAIESIGGNPTGVLHDSYKGRWRLLGGGPRTIRGPGTYDVPSKSWTELARPNIHFSALTRAEADPTWGQRLPDEYTPVRDDRWDSYDEVRADAQSPG